MLSSLATSHKIGIAIVAGVFIAFALASSFLIPSMRPDFPGQRVRLFVVTTILITAAMLGTIIWLAKEPKEPREAAGGTTAPVTRPTTSEPASTTPAPPPAATGGDAAAGKAVFASAGCTSCHTLKDANANGKVGPNLDDAKPSADKVVERVTSGKGVMPPFKGQLTEKQIQNVAAYVSSVAGKS